MAPVLRSASPRAPGEAVSVSEARQEEESDRVTIRRRLIIGVAIAVGLLFGVLAALVATWGMGH